MKLDSNSVILSHAVYEACVDSLCYTMPWPPVPTSVVRRVNLVCLFLDVGALERMSVSMPHVILFSCVCF